jgi:hypothetical protein
MHPDGPTRSVYLGKINPIPVVAAVYWLLMLVTGTDILNASLLAAAIGFGLMAVEAAGGIKTVAGLLNFVLILKFLLIGVVLKTVTFQAADSMLRAPRTTCKVMAVGFFALYLGSVLYRHTPKITGVVRDVNDAKMYLALTIVFSVVCFTSALVLLVSQISFDTSLSGGLWGLAHQYQGGISFCVIPAMYYAWSSGSRRFLSHPLVLTILAAATLFGIVSTTKQATMEPLLSYLSVGFIRYGLRSKPVWGIVAAGVFLYMTIVYPYSQWVRGHGGRDGTLAERMEAIQEVFFNVATNTDYRDMVETTINTGDSYLGLDSLSSIGRLAMVGEADRLIAATDGTQTYSGWDTIVMGLRLTVPSFLMADKPTSGGGNYFGHVAGDLAQDDQTTQVSYGFMAGLYNAFGLYGVLFGTIIFTFVFYYVIRLWFAAPDLSFHPFGSNIWYLMLGLAYQHSLVEAPIGNILPSMVTMSASVALILLARFLVSFFSYSRAPYGSNIYVR